MIRGFSVSLLTVAAIAVAAALLLASPLFQLRMVVVNGPGAKRVTWRALGVTRKTSLLAVVPQAMVDLALRADPLARRSVVTVAFPHALRIVLFPRTPICLVPGLGRGPSVLAVDRSAMVLPVSSALARSLPFCTGEPDVTRALYVDRAKALEADLRALEALPPSIVQAISEIHANGGSEQLLLLDGRPVRLGPPTNLVAKESLLPHLLARYPWPEYAGIGFDLENARRPALFDVG